MHRRRIARKMPLPGHRAHWELAFQRHPLSPVKKSERKMSHALYRRSNLTPNKKHKGGSDRDRMLMMSIITLLIFSTRGGSNLGVSPGWLTWVNLSDCPQPLPKCPIISDFSAFIKLIRTILFRHTNPVSIEIFSKPIRHLNPTLSIDTK